TVLMNELNEIDLNIFQYDKALLRDGFRTIGPRDQMLKTSQRGAVVFRCARGSFLQLQSQSSCWMCTLQKNVAAS
ncbi:hypothetical protein HAX54_012032, partial [Datura stramonium]|nr:hypothetical protein [Datura stramonium]